MEITRLPDIKTDDTENALREIRGYIVRLDRALSLLLDNVGSENLAPELYERVYAGTDKKIGILKNEIIETATEIREVSDKINLRLESDYVAKSDIGEYTEQAFQQITVDGKGVTQYFEEMSGITERLDGIEENVTENENSLVHTNAEISKINAYIRTGKLEDGVYGIEIGNFAGENVVPYKVRLSENKLAFYIANAEVAYFSDNSMYINNASVPNLLKIGECTVKSEYGLSFCCQ